MSKLSIVRETSAARRLLPQHPDSAYGVHIKKNVMHQMQKHVRLWKWKYFSRNLFYFCVRLACNCSLLVMLAACISFTFCSSLVQLWWRRGVTSYFAQPSVTSLLLKTSPLPGGVGADSSQVFLTGESCRRSTSDSSTCFCFQISKAWSLAGAGKNCTPASLTEPCPAGCNGKK